MWTQLHEYKVPCAGISLFTFCIGINLTSLSTFKLITVSSPRVWSAGTVNGAARCPWGGISLVSFLLCSRSIASDCFDMPLWLWCLSVNCTGQISLLSQQKKASKKKIRGEGRGDMFTAGSTLWRIDGQSGRSNEELGLQPESVPGAVGWVTLLSTCSAMCCVCSRVRWRGFHG